MRFLPPLLLHYYITERCNCRCTFCHIWRLPTRKSDDASLNDVVKNLSEAKKLGARFVDFTGGEPLLHDDLPAMLREAKRLGYKTSITTNGLRYETYARSLAGLVDFLHFSLDALDETKHNSIRGQQTFAHVMRSVDVARHLGEQPDLLFTVNEHNIDQLAPLVAFAQRLGLMLIVNPVFVYAHFEKSDVTFLKQIERFAASRFVYLNKAFHLLRQRGGNDRKNPRCRVMDSTIVLSPDNHVVLPCYHCRQDKVTLDSFRKSSTWHYYHKNQGRFDFCHGCHLNCYFDPSFHYHMDDYLWLSLVAKSRYWWDKNVYRKLFAKKWDARPAAEIAREILLNYAEY